MFTTCIPGRIPSHLVCHLRVLSRLVRMARSHVLMMIHQKRSDAKRGGIPILAVAVQEGMIELLNVSKRRDWDLGPCASFFHIHVYRDLGEQSHNVQPSRSTLTPSSTSNGV